MQKIVILTEEFSSLIYDTCVELALLVNVSQVTILKANTKLNNKIGIRNKLNFLYNKIKRKGLKYYIEKYIDRKFEIRKINETCLLIDSNRLICEKVDIINVCSHRDLKSLTEIYNADICFVIGCGVLGEDICQLAAGKTYIVHAADPREHTGVTLPAFWETIANRNNYRLSILELNIKLDAGQIVYQEEFQISSLSPQIILRTFIPKMLIKVLLGERKILPSNNLEKTFHKEINRQDLKNYRIRRQDVR